MTAAAFQATFSDWRLIKGRKCVQIVFEVPVEQADQAYQVLGGMPDPGKSVWCAVARLNKEGGEANPTRSEVLPERSDASNVTPPAPQTARAGRASPEKRMAQRAGQLCGNPVFQRFVREQLQYTCRNEDEAANVVRELCHVDSRSEIVPNSFAGKVFETIYSQFIAWRDVPQEVA